MLQKSGYISTSDTIDVLIHHQLNIKIVYMVEYFEVFNATSAATTSFNISLKKNQKNYHINNLKQVN